MKKLILVLSVCFVSACASSKKNSYDELAIAKIIASSEHIVMGEVSDDFQPDDNPNTIQYVFIKQGGSWVSDDGQVLYINASKDKGRQKELLEEAAKKRLDLLN